MGVVGHFTGGRFEVPQAKSLGLDVESVEFVYGQPLGALSSWPAFTLLHHLLIQRSAERVGIRGWFEDYAILGDDLVIGHAEVAREYKSLMQTLGVEISQPR